MYVLYICIYADRDTPMISLDGGLSWYMIVFPSEQEISSLFIYGHANNFTFLVGISRQKMLDDNGNWNIINDGQLGVCTLGDTLFGVICYPISTTNGDPLQEYRQYHSILYAPSHARIYVSFYDINSTELGVVFTEFNHSNPDQTQLYQPYFSNATTPYTSLSSLCPFNATNSRTILRSQNYNVYNDTDGNGIERIWSLVGVMGEMDPWCYAAWHSSDMGVSWQSLSPPSTVSSSNFPIGDNAMLYMELIAAQSQDVIWIAGSGHNVWVVENASTTNAIWTPIAAQVSSDTPQPSPNSIIYSAPHENIRCLIYEESSGVLFAGTDAGLYSRAQPLQSNVTVSNTLYIGGQWEYIGGNIPGNNIAAIEVLQFGWGGGRLIAQTWDGGLLYSHDTTLTTFNTLLSPSQSGPVVVDRLANPPLFYAAAIDMSKIYVIASNESYESHAALPVLTGANSILNTLSSLSSPLVTNPHRAYEIFLCGTKCYSIQLEVPQSGAQPQVHSTHTYSYSTNLSIPADTRFTTYVRGSSIYGVPYPDVYVAASDIWLWTGVGDASAIYNMSQWNLGSASQLAIYSEDYILLALSTHQLNIAISPDFGANWYDLTTDVLALNDLWADQDPMWQIYSVLFIPVQTNTKGLLPCLLIGTQYGIYANCHSVSGSWDVDGWTDWYPLPDTINSTSLPYTQVTALQYESSTSTLYVSTFGRGVWILARVGDMLRAIIDNTGLCYER